MTTNEKIDLLLKRQERSFRHLERRLNNVEARLLIWQGLALALLDDDLEISARELAQLVEKKRRQLDTRASEFPDEL